MIKVLFVTAIALDSKKTSKIKDFREGLTPDLHLLIIESVRKEEKYIEIAAKRQKIGDFWRK